MFVVLHYPLGTIRQQLSQDHVLQERESYVRGTALSTRHCQTTAQPGSRPTRERERVMFVVLHYPLGTVRQQLSQDHILQGRERELCSWYCTIHSALSDNSSARITSYKWESYARGTALSTRHCQTTAQPGSRPTRERERELCSWYCTILSALSDNSSARITSYKRERVMFVVLHYPLGTVRQQLSQDHVLQERESYVRGTALSTRHCQTIAQPGSRPTSERELCSWYCTIHSALSDNSSARITSYKRERERVMFVVLHYPLGTVRQQLSQDHVLQERERESYVRGTALSTRHCQTTAQPGSRPTRERERELCSWYCTIHSALSDNSSARITSYKRERELCSWYCTIHSALSDNSSARITSYKRERVMFVVLHYPLGTVRQ